MRACFQATALADAEEYAPAVFPIPLCLLLGLGLALMDQGLRGTAVFRTLILLPFALSFVVTGTVWAYMYRPTGGVLNSFLSMLGGTYPRR